VGLPSEAWGQKIVAVVVVSEACLSSGKVWAVADMKRALKQRSVAYKIMQDVQIVSTLKCNAMGKVSKKELVPAVLGNEKEIRSRIINMQAKRKA
jgi:malonyl-CoA/methylmalonyl-CoA synthetase